MEQSSMRTNTGLLDLPVYETINMSSFSDWLAVFIWFQLSKLSNMGSGVGMAYTNTRGGPLGMNIWSASHSKLPLCLKTSSTGIQVRELLT
jgi:hypothetical protein